MPPDVRRRLRLAVQFASQIRRGYASNTAAQPQEIRESDTKRLSLFAHQAAQPQEKSIYKKL
ncbi:MAG: hypothetical protein H0W45_06720 [Acidobacteria bacterium]|nr:hypothetical protein [Acidobacteriota bacterium]